MSPFRRRKTDHPAQDAPALEVRESMYRRLGQAMATVVVTVDAAPPDETRLRIRAGSTLVDIDPVMITHEAPGAEHEAHRLWFAAELSTVMFGDSVFTLVTGGSSVDVPEPLPGTDDEDGDEASAWSAGRAESELRAAVAALEERCRAAETANAELTADSRRIGETVAATLAEVQREREQLLELVARTDADIESGEAPPPGKAEPAAGETSASLPPRDLLDRIGAARGAASSDEHPS